jgi:hypothetical protein
MPTQAQLDAAAQAIVAVADQAVDNSADIPFFEKGAAKSALNNLAPQFASAALTAAEKVPQPKEPQS